MSYGGAMVVKIPIFDERTIKAEYLTALWRGGQVDRTAVLTSEYRLQNAGVRADLAILTNHLIGVEIKSGKDTLKRLRQQMVVYRAYFDRVVLIVVPKHLAVLSDEDVEGVELWTIDSAKNFRVLKEGLIADRSAFRHSLLPKRTVQRYAHRTPRDAFDLIFAERYGRTSDEFWKTIGRSRRIPEASLSLLSPFRRQREIHDQWISKQEQRWAEWESKAEAAFFDLSQDQARD